MKHLKFILILTLIISLAIPPTFASDDITVTIDGNEISFETEPERNGSTIMVPMKEFFEAMGARILWIESQRLVVAFKDNTHMKLQLGNNLAYRNGNKFMLESEPYISDGHTLVPIQIIAETFNMMPQWDEDTNTLALTGSEDNAGLKLFPDGIYKTRPINELGITISIPYHWETLDGPFQYGYQDDFESYSITLMAQSIDKTMTLEDLVNENKASLLDAYDENITFSGEESIKIDDILEVKKLYITTSRGEKKQRQVLYILKRNDKAYFMNGHYGAEVPEEDIIEVFDNVISTFKIRNLSVDTEEEHYMEFEDFYYSGMQLNQEYYSNMVVDKSKIPFSGTLEEGHGLDAFKIKVTSEKSSLDFIIPITGNAFDGTIYTPFGLGKHNIFISGIPAGALDNNNANADKPTSDKLTGEESDENPGQAPIDSDAPLEGQNEKAPAEDDSNEDDISTEDLDKDSKTSSDKSLSQNSEETQNETSAETQDKTVEETAEEATEEISETSSEAISKETSDTSSEDTQSQVQEEKQTESQTKTESETSSESSEATSADHATTESDMEKAKETVKNKALEEENEEEDQVPVETPSSSNAEVPMMQFSVINIDSRTMRYRIPTNVINSSDVQINSTSQLITYQNNSEYTKSRALFSWMIDNIAVDQEDQSERSNIEVFDQAIGSREEINQLYVAFLRAIDIPARVVKGSSDGDVYFWTELYLNGSWLISDVIEGIYVNNDDVIEHNPRSMFNIRPEVFENRYDLIQIMPY